MKRETRANWWFIVIFLIVSLPGAVILFIKKLDPSSARFDQPEEMLTSLPYMAPLPTPPGMKWIVPPKTLAWLREVKFSKTSESLLSAVPPGPEWEPDISVDHRVQLLGSGGPFGDPTDCFLIWDGSLPTDLSAFQVTDLLPGSLNTDDELKVLKVESIIVPQDVRHELVALGFVRPPEHVLWIEVHRGLTIRLPNERFTIDCPRAVPPLHSSVDWPYQGSAATTSSAP